MKPKNLLGLFFPNQISGDDICIKIQVMINIKLYWKFNPVDEAFFTNNLMLDKQLGLYKIAAAGYKLHTENSITLELHAGQTDIFNPNFGYLLVNYRLDVNGQDPGTLRDNFHKQINYLYTSELPLN